MGLIFDPNWYEFGCLRSPPKSLALVAGLRKALRRHALNVLASGVLTVLVVAWGTFKHSVCRNPRTFLSQPAKSVGRAIARPRPPAEDHVRLLAGAAYSRRNTVFRGPRMADETGLRFRLIAMTANPRNDDLGYCDDTCRGAEGNVAASIVASDQHTVLAGDQAARWVAWRLLLLHLAEISVWALFYWWLPAGCGVIVLFLRRPAS